MFVIGAGIYPALIFPSIFHVPNFRFVIHLVSLKIWMKIFSVSWINCAICAVFLLRLLVLIVPLNMIRVKVEMAHLIIVLAVQSIFIALSLMSVSLSFFMLLWLV